MKKWHYLTALGLLTLASAGFPKDTLSGQATFNVSLGLTGYNGFALNHLTIDSITGASGVVGMAWWDGTGYQTASFTASQLNTLGTKRGYWLFTQGPTSFSYSGNDSTGDKNINLVAGWNMVGFPNAGSDVLGSALSVTRNGQPVSLGSVVLTNFFEIGTNNQNTAVDVQASGSVLKAGRPYWVFALEPVVLNYGSGGGASFTIERVSFTSTGNQTACDCYRPTISNDGRMVAFEAAGPNGNLVPTDTNDKEDCYAYDRQTGQLTRVSVGQNGEQATQPTFGLVGSTEPRISGNGQSVAFESNGLGLKTDFPTGIFVRDLQANALALMNPASNNPVPAGAWNGRKPGISGDGQRVSFATQTTVQLQPMGIPTATMIVQRPGLTVTTVNITGAASENRNALFSNDGNFLVFEAKATSQSQIGIWVRDSAGALTQIDAGANNNSGFGGDPNGQFGSGISADGRFVVFQSAATNLVANDTNNATDIFVRDRQSGQTTRVSVAADGTQANASSTAPSISADGRFVAFASGATNLVSGVAVNNGVFVKDRQTGAVVVVSRNVGGTASGGCAYPMITGDGRNVAFSSIATTLVPNDTNNRTDCFVARNVLAP